MPATRCSGGVSATADFRNRYSAVVLAVARHGERIHGKVGDIVLRAGDTLLLEARPAFVHQQRNSRDFYLVSTVQDSAPLNHERALLAFAILGAMVGVSCVWAAEHARGCHACRGADAAGALHEWC